MSHQDFKEVVFKKQSTSKKQNNYFELSKDQKLDNDSDNLSHSNVGLSLGKQIRKARIDKGYKTQLELANCVNVRADIISSYENGRAIPDNAILQRLRRVLNTQLKVR